MENDIYIMQAENDKLKEKFKLDQKYKSNLKTYIKEKKSMEENSKNKSKTEEAKEIELLPTMNSESNAPNRIWVGTFQIVWNEVADNIVKAPIEFVTGTTQTAKDLNSREFKKSDISEDSYYTTYGVIEPSLKTRIISPVSE